jgi:hypothetical protein
MAAPTPEDPALYRTEARFNAIYVIESLPEGDSKTGQALYDEVVFPGTMRLDGLETKFVRVETPDDLAGALADVTRAVHLSGRLPILHFEMHGYDSGIALADGTLVPWSDLVPLLGDINRVSRMNLVVVAIACMGWNLTHALMPNDRAPLFMLVGPPSTMTAGELLQATRQFYDVLFTYLDVNKALEAMNAGLDYGDWRLKPATAEILFCRVFRAFLAEGNSFSATAEVENELVAKAVRRGSLSLQQAAVFRDKLRRGFGDPRWWYDHLRETFLWMDLYPADKWRFGLDYDLCFGKK